MKSIPSFDENGHFEIGLTWYQDVSLCLIDIIKDVDLIKYFINILDGNTCYNTANKFEYLLSKPQYQHVKQYKIDVS